MLGMHSSALLKRVARRDNAARSEETRTCWRDKRGEQGKLTLIRMDLADASSVADAMSYSMAGRQKAAAFWSSVMHSILESFAMYGASVHATAYFPVALRSGQEENLKQRTLPPRGRRELISLASSHAGGDKVLPELERGTERALSAEIELAFASNSLGELNDVKMPHVGWSKRWSWLALPWEVVVTLWTHVRREREIRRAVSALENLDERILRDMGIPDRSQIEQVIRYCHDC
jgi:uncharacterized protein YjiS (DUF1127 family)